MGTAIRGTTSRRPWPSPRCGLDDEADRAYQWLAANQLADGSWFNYYLATGIKDARLDTNVCAYLATGVYHHYLVTGEIDGLDDLWPVVERAIDFVLRWQRPDGTVVWSLDAAGRPEEEYALLTGSSSIYHSLRCAVAIAERLGKECPDWELAAGRLGHAVAHHARSFAPKNEFAMDWYYPVLAGALGGEAASRPHRDECRGSTFNVMEGPRVRCVSTNDWITAAETAECVLALDALPGLDEEARDLLRLGLAGGLRSAGRRLLLDRHGLPRGGVLPRRRAHHLHGGVHHPGRRRAVGGLGCGRALPGGGVGGRPRPGRTPLHRRGLARLHGRAVKAALVVLAADHHPRRRPFRSGDCQLGPRRFATLTKSREPSATLARE